MATAGACRWIWLGFAIVAGCSQPDGDDQSQQSSHPTATAEELRTQPPADRNKTRPALFERDFEQDTIDYFSRLDALGFAAGLLVAQGERSLIHTGFGLADRESGRRWSTITISTIGSITKQFTGASILALQEDGRLKVSDPITDHFDSVPDDKAGITLHHLLTHSSGLVDPSVGDWDPVDREAYVQLALSQPLDFEPGTSYSYSNAGYSLLGAIIENLSDMPYESYLRTRLLLPAGLTETGYLQPAWESARIAVGYQGDARWGTVLERPMAEDGPYWALRANGGIHSSTGDMWRWGRALLTGEVLSAESMRAYWKPHVDEGYGDSWYGYGWVVLQGPGDQQVITHNGGNGIFFADMAIYPDTQVVMVLQTNVADQWPSSDRLLGVIGARLFTGAPYPDARASENQ